MVNTNDYHGFNITPPPQKKNASDSNYDHFFWVVVTGPFLQCSLHVSDNYPIGAKQNANKHDRALHVETFAGVKFHRWREELIFKD